MLCQGDVKCYGCGAVLIKEDCLYCGRYSDYIFITEDQFYNEIRNSMCFLPIGICTLYGKQIVLKK